MGTLHRRLVLKTASAKCGDCLQFLLDPYVQTAGRRRFNPKTAQNDLASLRRWGAPCRVCNRHRLIENPGSIAIIHKPKSALAVAALHSVWLVSLGRRGGA